MGGMRNDWEDRLRETIADLRDARRELERNPRYQIITPPGMSSVHGGKVGRLIGLNESEESVRLLIEDSGEILIVRREFLQEMSP